MRITTRRCAAEDLAAATATQLPARAGRAWTVLPGLQLEDRPAAGLTDGQRTLLLAQSPCGQVRMAAWPCGRAPLAATAVPHRSTHPRHIAAAAARHHLPAADAASPYRIDAADPSTQRFSHGQELLHELCSSPLAPARRAVTDHSSTGFLVAWDLGDGTRVTATPSGDRLVVVRATQIRLPFAERLLRLALDGRTEQHAEPADISGAAARRLAAAWPLTATGHSPAGTTRLTARPEHPLAPQLEITIAPGLAGSDRERVDVRLRCGVDLALLALAALR